jgi:hypothetical protein
MVRFKDERIEPAANTESGRDRLGDVGCVGYLTLSAA